MRLLDQPTLMLQLMMPSHAKLPLTRMGLGLLSRKPHWLINFSSPSLHLKAAFKSFWAALLTPELTELEVEVLDVEEDDRLAFFLRERFSFLLDAFSSFLSFCEKFLEAFLMKSEVFFFLGIVF